MTVTNQRTVTIKMTRGEALRLARLVLNHAICLENDEYEDKTASVKEWKTVHDKIRAGVDALDQKEV